MRHLLLIAIPLLVFDFPLAQAPADSSSETDSTRVAPQDEPPDVTNVVNEEELRRRGLLRDTGVVVEVEDILPGAAEPDTTQPPSEVPPEPVEETVEEREVEPDSSGATETPEISEEVDESGAPEVETGESVKPPEPQEPEESPVVEEEDILEEFTGDDFSIEAGEESLFEGQGMPQPAEGGGGGGAAADAKAAGSPPQEEPQGEGIDVPQEELAEEAVEAEDVVDENIPAQPARIEDVHSIDFARNLEEYRSPKLAMLLSLLVPGAGQAYARNYWKTALFGVVEAAVIGVSVGYNIRGRNETRKAHRFADKHFTSDTFRVYYDSLRSYIKNYSTAADSISDETVEKWMNEIFFAFEDESFIDTFMNEARKGTNGYYNRIGDLVYVQGWDDAEPALEQMKDAHLGNVDTLQGQHGRYIPHEHPDSTYLVYRIAEGEQSKRPTYGYSPNQLTYNDIMSVASSYYSTSINVLFLLLANHIASAIDAGITAKNHNDRLLGKKSVWDRIEIERRWVNTGSEMAPGYAVKIDF